MTVRTTALLLAALHAAVLVVWTQAGWLAGLGAMAGLHVALVAQTLWPRATLFCPAWRRFAASGREVCLTIDDGPCADTRKFLDILDEFHAPAVFFLIGERAAARPDEVREMVGRGHAVANHTQTHPATTFWCYPPGRQRREIRQCQEILTALTGTVPQWFRAPAGFRNPFTWPVLREAGLRYAGWSARGLDTASSGIPRILERLTRNLQPGAILLLHQGHPHSPALLRALLTRLATDGWTVVLPAEFAPGPALPS